MEPHQYRKRVLLAVTGLNPQIVTETLYALCQTRAPSFIPTEVHLITTREGAERAELTLLHASQGKFHQLCQEYGLIGKIRFDESHIHTINALDGEPLPDIRTPEENSMAADCITAMVRKFTADPDCALHASIAGGRKTMGYYLGYALSLFGRNQDRLSHVLVNEPFENNHAFYFPPARPEVLFTRDNKPINTANAQVMLAEIPFLRLRHGLDPRFLAEIHSFGETVDAVQLALGAPNLRIDLPNKAVICSGRPVRLTPQLLAFYAYFAQIRINTPEGTARVSEMDCEAFLLLYRQIVGEWSADYEDLEKELASGMAKEFFDEKKSRINRILRQQLGPVAESYLLVSMGKRPNTRTALAVDSSSIFINEPNGSERQEK